jgi:hypothetical protein
MAATSAQSGIDVTPHATQILSHSGGFPYFLQMACWHCYEAIANGVEIGDIVWGRFLAEAAPAFDGLWRRLAEHERAAIRALGRGDTGVDVPESLVERGYVSSGKVFSSAFEQYALGQ